MTRVLGMKSRHCNPDVRRVISPVCTACRQRSLVSSDHRSTRLSTGGPTALVMRRTTRSKPSAAAVAARRSLVNRAVAYASCGAADVSSVRVSPGRMCAP